MAPAASRLQEFKNMPLYMSCLERLRQEHIIDVLKMVNRPKRKVMPQAKGMSDEACTAREALANDPYNLELIVDLGYKYCVQGHLERAANVMLRGWKRADEIEDAHARFCFLMKLCEVSYLMGRFKQAAAVLQDIAEPEDPSERKSYFILSCHVHSVNKDAQKTLRCFQKAIEGEDFEMTVRIYALTLLDLKEVDLYFVARTAVERIAGDFDKDAVLPILDHYAKSKPEPKSVTADNQRFILIAAAVALASVLIYLLYLAEQWSLERFRK